MPHRAEPQGDVVAPVVLSCVKCISRVVVCPVYQTLRYCFPTFSSISFYEIIIRYLVTGGLVLESSKASILGIRMIKERMCYKAMLAHLCNDTSFVCAIFRMCYKAMLPHLCNDTSFVFDLVLLNGVMSR